MKDMSGGAVSSPVRDALGPLWRNWQFQTLWIGSAASTLGVAVADVAYPLVILAVTGSPARAGLFAAVQTAGQIAAGLPAGHLADRYDLRRTLIVSEACGAVITGVVALALVLGFLSLPVLICTAALLGAGQAISGSPRLLLMRAVVPPEQLTRALTQDEVRMSGAQLAGPPLGGALFAVRALAHAVPFLFIAASSLVSLITATMVTALPVAAGPGEGSDLASGGGGMLAGVRALWRSPLLRASTLLIMMVNTVGAGLTLVIVVILRHQAVPAPMIGLALAGEAAGGLAGAPLVRHLHRLRPGVLLLAVCMLLVPVLALLAVPLGPWWVAGLLFGSMLGVPAIRVLIDVLIIRRAPEGQRGRTVSAAMTLFGLGMPVGTAASGLLLQYLPASTAMLVLAAALAAGVGYCASNAELWRARWP